MILITIDLNSLFDFFFGPYREYTSLDILLEFVAVIFGFLSVFYAKNNKILVYPTGMISTAIYVYLLVKWELLGDMMINGYYFVMSAYGWYFWTQKKEGELQNPIAKMKHAEVRWSIFIFIGALLFVGVVYLISDRWNTWSAYVDTFTTAVFFVGMWLMARRKIEHWIFWIIGDIISVPLYFYKGLTLTSFQYLIFTFIAIFGYRSWRENLTNIKPTV